MVTRINTPNGIAVDVPDTDDEDISPKFGLDQLDAALAYYRAEGYVVFRRLIAAEDCDAIRALWEAEVKPFGGAIYRQATAKAERHVTNRNGWIMNPILNLQSVDPRRFPTFRQFAVDRILTSAALKTVARHFLGDNPKIVQSMYFEGNSATWEHQDSYYLDSENIGTMTAAWIAIEDIAATAGRFFICPKSHKIDLGEQDIYNNIADNHDVYIGKVVDEIRARQMEIRAPKLDKGDVLFWNAWTIHGSLASQDEHRSRSSITCHMIPARDRFLQLQTRVLELQTDVVNDVHVFRPKDQQSPANRAVLWAESNFPGPFYWLKKKAVKAAIRAKQR
ncbi:phytanoyl-CoA dioxygenase family protein [Polymorphobacter sp.]|uniref:phytanoyl-CoA dioxygenase family protein n=1 Tax=Polymorphobacter sp. TaxID=1909290 RepID=UPI003F6FEB59